MFRLHRYGVKWCNQLEIELAMATKAKRSKQAPAEPKTLRASVGFPRALYAALEDLAKEKKVSIAWIVRDAAEQYVASRWPLLGSALSEPISRRN